MTNTDDEKATHRLSADELARVLANSEARPPDIGPRPGGLFTEIVDLVEIIEPPPTGAVDVDLDLDLADDEDFEPAS